MATPQTLPRPQRAAPAELDTAPATRERPRFPGWRWMAVWLAFPVAGYIGWKIGGRVDAVDAALVGGALTGAGLGAVQWWAAKGALGRAAAWIGASAVGYAVGLAAGAALVGYDTDLGSLAVMGLVSGAALGAAQGLVLARQGRRALALPWALAMPVLFALGWSVASVTGIGVDDQFTVFGAGGALVFTLLSGLLLARFTPARAQGGVMDAVDHVVLGAGAVGMAIAEALARRGESVRVVNRSGLREPVAGVQSVAGAHGAPGVPGDAQNHEPDRDADHWVGDSQAERDQGGAGDHGQAHVGVRAVGDQRRTV